MTKENRNKPAGRETDDTGQAHKEAQLVDDETSNVNEEAHQTSPHQRYQSY